MFTRFPVKDLIHTFVDQKRLNKRSLIMSCDQQIWYLTFKSQSKYIYC